MNETTAPVVDALRAPDLRFCKLVIGHLMMRPGHRIALTRDELCVVLRLARWWGVPIEKDWASRRNCLIRLGAPAPTFLPAEHFA